MTNKPKLIIAGGAGFLGVLLQKHLSTTFNIIILTRSPKLNNPHATEVYWNACELDTWQTELNDAEVIINLTGKSVDCRYNSKNKAEILASRIDSTNIIAEAIKNCPIPPRVWINAASATIYRHAEDRAMDEYSGEIGNGFSVEVCKAWEAAFFSHNLPQTRLVALRTAMVMGTEGGVYPVLSRLAKIGLGGTQGNGKQYLSWLHSADWVSIITFVIQNKGIVGYYNATAPNPETNNVFMKTLRKSLNIKIGLRNYSWMLKIGAWLLGTETELVIKSRRVIPTKLIDAGYSFNFVNIEACLNDLAQA